MPFGGEPVRSGPEGLFAPLAVSRAGFFEVAVLQAPLRSSLIFFFGIVGLTLFLALAEARAVDNGAVVDLLPSEAVFAILMGMVVFPLRLIFVPLATYIVGFTLSFLLRLWLEADYLPPGGSAGVVLVWSMLLNAVPALIAGLAGRMMAERWASRQGRRVMIQSLTMTATYLVLSGLGVWLVVTLLFEPGWRGMTAGGTLGALEAGLFRAARIALCGAVLALLLLDRPTRRNLRVAWIVLPAFVVLGVLRVLGYALHPTLDVELLALAVTLIAPVYAAVLANVIGVVAYVAITGEFLVQIPVPTPDVMRLEIVSILLLGLIYVLLLQRHLSMIQRRAYRQTLQRIVQVNDLATIGHFVVNIETGAVVVDDVAATMLGMPNAFDIQRFLERVSPADRGAIVTALGDQKSETRSLSFLLADGAVWEEGAPRKYLTVHAWYERRKGEQTRAYGALIDLTADHIREEALAQALRRLSDQQDRQTRMFSIVSHELRTPAAVISMMVEELDAGARWADIGPRIKAVSEQLLSVLADMRQAVRPEENLPVRMDPFQPRDVMETVRNTFLLMAGSNGIEIELALAPEAAQTRVSDRVRLVQALSNLVKNAILHSGCRRITLSYAEEAGLAGPVARWRVSDDGHGIPEAARSELFIAFRRGDGARTAQVDGSGLGLYVTRTSIELLGGTVQHMHGAEGGSVFVLTVPLIEAAEPVQGAAPVPAGTERDRAPRPGWRERRVLIVEDSDLIGELLTARLKRVFGAVDWVRNGKEALAVFDSLMPDIVLTDLFMPEMGGDELTAALRLKGVTCPIIGMTAAAIGDERTLFEQAGTDRVLTKPVSTHQLMDVLDEMERIRG
ncbi:hybrid sensor histidine kinase/response regulator [Paragemmobacter ruber]|uniref:histidine kinase n=1 Tax=Paragemmobacter ruber TaxID=1985673 RepID=A0ABW9Y2X1_9RHOB|nr:hybrid sensor histidine kinase/response regulator [Rhodobacter ruber]NBE06868.1 response regulator [Rhodobacter ruber]